MCSIARFSAMLLGPVILSTVLMAGCSSQGYNGTALDNPPSTRLGITTMGQGNRFGLLLVNMWNISKQPLEITEIPIEGQGIGKVLQAVKEQIGEASSGRTTVPAGGYDTYPPVFSWNDGATCYVQQLEPVAGYKLLPGAHARLYLELKAINTGSFKVANQTVYYTQGGVQYKQVLRTGFDGSVHIGAKIFGPSENETPCSKDATLLNRTS
jgi:hypothetical protein